MQFELFSVNPLVFSARVASSFKSNKNQGKTISHLNLLKDSCLELEDLIIEILMKPV